MRLTNHALSRIVDFPILITMATRRKAFASVTDYHYNVMIGKFPVRYYYFVVTVISNYFVCIIYSTVRDSYVQSGRPLMALFRLVARHDRPNVNVSERLRPHSVQLCKRTIPYRSL